MKRNVAQKTQKGPSPQAAAPQVPPRHAWHTHTHPQPFTPSHQCNTQSKPEMMDIKYERNTFDARGSFRWD